MLLAREAKDSLREIVWEEGKEVPVAEGPYRYQIVVLCTFVGRQRAEFANGEHQYYCYLKTVSGGKWIKEGANIVPVLPDGRLLMVVEQRPAQGRNRPMVVELGDQDVDSPMFSPANRGRRRIDLGTIGPYSSLEFPGGGIDPGESLRIGFLRELQQETGIPVQYADCYICNRPVYGFGSDIACKQNLVVAYLSVYSFAPIVETDGGLTVLALTRYELDRCIWTGVICSGQAALLPYGFYAEVARVRRDPDLLGELVEFGYLTVRRLRIE